MVQLPCRFVLVITELTVRVRSVTGTKDIIDAVEGFIGRHGQLTIQLHMIIVRVVGTADTVVVIAQLPPHTIVGIDMLRIGSTFGRNTESDIRVPCSDNMFAGVERHIIVQAFDGRITFL